MLGAIICNTKRLEGIVPTDGALKFDAILVDVSCGAFDRFAEAVRTPTRLQTDLEQFINLGDDRNVRRVWVRGRECVRKDR